MIRLHNTLTKQLDFLPNVGILNGALRVYACGVTPYDHCHIGHARSYITWDVLRRWLEFRGRPVKYVQNFTDIDDKIIERARQEHLTCDQIADRYIASYFEDFDWLNVRRADEYPRVTKYFWAMAGWVNEMLVKGLAYEVPDGVRFNGQNFKNYGQLSGHTTCEDFYIWKNKPEEKKMFVGGRPGWHTECAVFIKELLGGSVDIHCGGHDLIFPHHENEIAISESLFGTPLASMWLHNGFVENRGQKMSKSEGNAIYLRDLRAETIDPNMLRFWILQAHYRQPLDQYGFHQCYLQWRSLRNKLLNAPEGCVTKGFIEALDDDLNTPLALAELHKEPSQQMATLLGFKVQHYEVPADIRELAARRAALRDEKKWAEADAVRDEIVAQGWQVQDSNFEGRASVYVTR